MTVFAIKEEEYYVGLYNVVTWDLAQVLKKLDSGVGVLAQRTLGGSADRARLVEALDAGAADEWGGIQCFEPRHAVIVRDGTHTMVAIVCFQCHYLVVFGETRHATTGFCDVTGIEKEWHDAFARAGVETPTPPICECRSRHDRRIRAGSDRSEHAAP